jgi:hypothetical protein
MSMSEGVKEKKVRAETKVKAKGKGRAKKAVAVVAIVLVALLVLSTLGDVIDDACAKAGISGGIVGKLKEGVKRIGEKVKSAFEELAGWLFGKFKASAPSASTSTTSTSTTTPTSTPPTSTPPAPAQPVEVNEPVILSVKAVPVKVSPKLFSDEVSSMEDPRAIIVNEGCVWNWTDECAHSGRHSIKGRGGFWLKLPTNRSDFNLYDRLVMYVKVVAPREVVERLDSVIIWFHVPGWGPFIGFTLEPHEEDTPWGKLSVSKEGDWWRIELNGIKWGCFGISDWVGFSVVPGDPKLYNDVTFYVDDVQLYSSRSNACLLLIDARKPPSISNGSKEYCTFEEETTVKNLRTGENGFSYKGIYDRELLRSLGRPTVNEVYVPISVEKGDVLEATFTFTYYYSDGKYLYKDDALVFNRTVTVTVE